MVLHSKKRRNGLLQACEPCRKRKLACDHDTPCSRCVKRNTQGQCRYHPAPMTRAGPAPASGVISRRAPPLEPPHLPLAHSEAFHAREHRGDEQRPKIDGPVTISESGLGHRSLRSSHGYTTYFGESSSSAVIEELNGNLGMDGGEVNVLPSISVSETKIQQSTEVLSHLQNAMVLAQFFYRWLATRGGYIVYSQVYHIWLAEVNGLFKSAAVAGGPALNELTRVVWQNTQRTMTCRSSTPVSIWAKQSSLRWESIGLIFSALGLMAGTLSPQDPIFTSNPGERRDRHALVTLMARLVHECIGFCRESEARNDLFLCLLYESTILLGRTVGNTSAETWLRVGEVCDTAVLLGLHGEKSVDAQTPFYLCELRVRLFEQIYGYDKFLSTYLGRPPRISYRHCQVQQALDLSDEQACLPEPALSAAISRLRDGWSPTGPLNRSSWRRVMSRQSLIREDILGITLGSFDQDLETRISIVRAGIENTRQDFPLFAKMDPDLLMAQLQESLLPMIPGRNVPWQPLDAVASLCMHCDYLHNDFLLERAIVMRLKCDATKLITSAREVLRLALKVFQMKDFFCDFRVDMINLLAFYALPSAGVLAIELLKQNTSSSHDPFLPRSEIIQQFSILVCSLENVGPTEGIYSLCALGLRAMKRVLDVLLAPPKSSQDSGTGDFVRASLDFEHYLASQNDTMLLEWLGTTDFDYRVEN
ncbi:Hypothetical protein R9X50_00513000 [Acrodontium crateriforme]|uniref:Zn(2)-C6 fungal-type domain-containing protein n=1 Tax=Acrodontium crateriforme TaxID=150365 RepID=A0AAQ3M6K5_9PEZI|nr:Hypothetical protein R9X50_00513000 [Acrodontium crateriforme]